MYLKSLELVGFKSFAVKTTLDFHRGVTAVVGPNGCGKSNVLDAIRWVLGEQSAKALRGGEMADVIFSGTDSRPPLGMAEVSMTFSDCEKELGVEWNEVRITRRVFRDGKSEYFINKTPCRLRDIQELFMDTGIGRSAYSIMEQGKIDQILSSKPEDRRAIFEEAAGITKYKAQKREALRKLEHTEANLVRVADIIREVKRQIGSLQRQAGKARKYQAISNTLRVFDTHLTHYYFSTLGDELHKIQAEIESIDTERLELENESASCENQVAALHSELAEIDEEVSRVRAQVQELHNQTFSAQNRIESHGQRIEETRSLIQRNESEIALARERIADQESAIERTDLLIQELLETLRIDEEELRAREAAAREARVRREEAEREFSKAGHEANRIEAEINHLRAERSNTLGRREAAESRLAALHAQESEFVQTVADFEARRAETETRIVSLEARIAEASLSIDTLAAELDAAQATRHEASEAYRSAERALAEARSKLEVLRSLEAAGEGLGEATQAVLRGLDNPTLYTPVIYGALATLLEVREEYVAAIEAILGEDLQAVFFKDADIAESALKALEVGGFGRGRILARGQLQHTVCPSNTYLPDEALAWAIHCVRPPSELRSVVLSKLKDIAIVPDMETALRLHKKFPHLGFATLAGGFVPAEGIPSAGRSGQGTRAAILRKNEIALAAAARDAAAARLETARQANEEISAECIRIEQALAESRQLRQSLQVELSGLRGELTLLERQAVAERARHESLLSEIEVTKSIIEQAGERLAELEKRLASLAVQLDEMHSRRLELEHEVSVLRDRERDEIDQLNEIRLRVATERQQRENLQRQREPMAARVHELAELLASRARDIEDYTARIANLETEIAELEAKKIAWASEIESLDAQLAALLARRAEIRESANALESSLRVARHQIQELQERRGKLEIRSTQIELRRENLREHTARRYSIELAEFEPDRYALLKAWKEHSDGAAKEAGPSSEAEGAHTQMQSRESNEIPWEEIARIVAELTTKLDAMGPVNLDAIQEYEELEERYQFLEQQNTDLLNSKSELLEVISRINKTTREMFSETFAKIRENFQEMFSELFGGGKANLILLDESDPLESGIEIIAKPPGKQLQNISLLSGGEKTMTAVALLFAIYMVKPSPFCVLDEMDAPLDESNINRFIKILDRFVEQSQFVVITHNKRTISRADYLYGVTMEEHGVSKLVGVRFQSASETSAVDAKGHSPSVAETFGKSGDLHSESVSKQADVFSNTLPNDQPKNIAKELANQDA